MRASIVCLAALALAACGPPRSIRESRGPTLEPRSARAIRVYEHAVPRWPYRDVGRVSGRSYREFQSAAFRLRANAVILEPRRPGTLGGSDGTRAGTAVAFTRVDCQQ
ncbi:MAG: hypothetical protein KY467_08790 [Gemmatimonadetes bacterium]|nr:hypothetical protein [Gemmatimonadota bacterium]